MFYSISVRVNTVVDDSERLYYINDTHHPVFRDANDTKCDVAVREKSVDPNRWLVPIMDRT